MLFAQAPAIQDMTAEKAAKAIMQEREAMDKQAQKVHSCDKIALGCMPVL